MFKVLEFLRDERLSKLLKATQHTELHTILYILPQLNKILDTSITHSGHFPPCHQYPTMADQILQSKSRKKRHTDNYWFKGS
jgi:hypothetical protein